MAGYSIKPDYEPHANLETDVTQYLESNGYIVDSAPYHDKMDKSIIKVLQNIYTPTGLYLRGRADRIAVKRNPPTVFEWEAKTHKSQSRHDCVIEALPICTHLIHAKYLAVRCLYVYRNPFKNQDFGFWVHQIPPIRIIMIPGRWNKIQRQHFEQVFNLILPQVKVVSIGRTRGTDDPFLIIDESEMKKLPHWKEAIQEMEARND